MNRLLKLFSSVIFLSFLFTIIVYASDFYSMKGVAWGYSYSGSVRKDTITFYPSKDNYYKINFMFQVTPDQFDQGIILYNPNDGLNMGYGVLTSDFDIYSKFSSFTGSVRNTFSIDLIGVDQHLPASGTFFDLSDITVSSGAYYYIYASYNYSDYSKVTADPYIELVPAPTPIPTAVPTPTLVPTPSATPVITPGPSALPLPSGIASGSEELGTFGSGSGLDVWQMFLHLLGSLSDSGLDLSDDMEIPSPALTADRASAEKNNTILYDNIHFYAESAASSSPAPTLDDYDFWAFCYDVNWQSGSTAGRSAKHRFVPSAMSDMSGDSSYSYVFTYPVRIPFRITTDFKGVGYLDANFSFNPDYKIFGINGYGLSGSSALVNGLIDISSPWVESSSEISFNASIGGTYGNSFDIINLPLVNGASPEFYLCFDLYLSATTGSTQVSGLGDYLDVTLSDLGFEIITSAKISDSASEDILQQIKDNQENFHQEEMDKADEAVDQITSGLDEITGTLSSWQIITMPVTLVKDFVTAVSSEGSSGLTFPTFSLMGYQLWPSYTFDLKTVKEKFPVLYNALHLIGGIVVVSWFIHYLWRKWANLMNDDMPDAGAGGGDK